MRRNLIFALIVISTLIVVSSTPTSSASAIYGRLGVRTGDWIDYSVSYYSTSPSHPESEYVSEGYSRIHVDISSVVGTNVTLLITYFYPDGEESSATWSGDVCKKQCDYVSLAGLEEGDIVYTEDWREVTVSETANMTVLGTQRSINIVIPSGMLDAQEILFFDRTTGVLVESYRSSMLFGWMVERITSSSVLPSVWLQLGLVFTALAVVALIIIAVVVVDRRPCTRKSQLGR